MSFTVGGAILPQWHMTTFILVSTKGDMYCFFDSVSCKVSLASKWSSARWSFDSYRKVSIKLLELFWGISFFPLQRSQLYFYLCSTNTKLIDPNADANMYILMKRNTLVKSLFQDRRDDTSLGPQHPGYWSKRIASFKPAWETKWDSILNKKSIFRDGF